MKPAPALLPPHVARDRNRLRDVASAAVRAAESDVSLGNADAAVSAYVATAKAYADNALAVLSGERPPAPIN